MDQPAVPSPADRGAVASDPPGDPNAELMEAKRRLRARLRAERRELYRGENGPARRASEAEALVAAAEPMIADLVLRARALDRPLCATAFSPTPSEPDVLRLLTAIRERVADVQFLFPGTSGGKDLDWILGDPATPFTASAGAGFGAEPEGEHLGADGISRADLVLAPALALDRSGTRLGHGGGYYDRALPRRRPGVPVIAVVHPTELLEAGSLPRSAHDQTVDAALTADGLVPLPSTL